MSKIRDIESGIRRLLDEVRDIRAENAALVAENAETLGALRKLLDALVEERTGENGDEKPKRSPRLALSMAAARRVIAKAERQS